MTDIDTAALRGKIERRLTSIALAEAGKRCAECAHVKHNDLGYCQVGQCACESGTSLAATAEIVLRDLPALLAAVERERDEARATLARVEELRDSWARDGLVLVAPISDLIIALTPDAKETDR